jgi:hypothetical protein
VTVRCDPADALLAACPPVRSSALVALNVCGLRILSNVANFEAFSYFSQFRPPAARADYELFCVDLDRDDVEETQLAALADSTYRADRLRKGYYLAHHFGPPAYLITRGHRYYLFGRRLERIVWPYFVKHLLTIFGVDRGMVHLKAAAFVRSGAATLLVGRGGGGKTVFLSQACLAGASFVSNTHVLVSGRTVYGVPSALRVRPAACFDELISSGRAGRHLDDGEYRLDPTEVFGSVWPGPATVRTICIVDYQPDRHRRLEEVSEADCLNFLSHFALAVPTYGLKDDVLAHLDGDLDRYLAACRYMNAELEQLVASSRRFVVNADMMDPAVRASVLAAVSGEHGIGDEPVEQALSGKAVHELR